MAEAPTWVRVSDQKKVLCIGTDCKRFVNFWRWYKAGDVGTDHLKEILAYLKTKLTILKLLNWDIAIFFYPREHPMIREMDAICRQYAYRRALMDFYPTDLWKAIMQDSAVYLELHRMGRPEPPMHRQVG